MSESKQTTSKSTLTQAEQMGFKQCVYEVRQILYTTPIGWALVAWLSGGIVPTVDLLTWIGIFAFGWTINILILRHFSQLDTTISFEKKMLTFVTVSDGICWGLLTLLLMTYDRYLDSWLVIVLCGVASVNLPTYITFPTAFRHLVLAMWVTVLISVWILSPHMLAIRQLIFGLTVYFCLLIYTLDPISTRVIEGIRLQLENDALAVKLKEALEKMELQATTDALTGQLNRHALDTVLGHYINEAKNHQFKFSLFIIDIDFFKKINDTYGHIIGDQALKSVAKQIRSQLRPRDTVARYGGEEFVVLLPDIVLDDAIQIAERIRLLLATVLLETTPPMIATASIGVTTYQAPMSAELLLKAADDGLYEAKRSGRNRVVVHSCADQSLLN